jgi:broad specificity phosphatase PhoE
MVTEVLSDDGEGNRVSDIYAEFDPTADGWEQAQELADALNREIEQEIYSEFG